MKPSLPPIATPQNCGNYRSQYADTAANQQFISEVQASYDSLASYINSSLESDLAEINKESDPGTIMKNLARYVRIEKLSTATQDYLLFNQVVVYDKQNNNVALNKATKSSSAYMTFYSSEKAVNGQIQNMENNFVSQFESNAFWEVDLNNPIPLSRIMFYNTMYQGWLENMTKYKLRVLNSNRDVISEFLFTANAIQEFVITSPTSKAEAVRQKMSDLLAVEEKLQRAMKCLDLEVNQRTALSADIYSLQDTAKEKSKLVDTKKVNVNAAKERAHLLRDPYTEVSNWESWFPLGRPLEKHSVPVLWFFSIVFLILSIGLFLQLAGFTLDIGGRIDQARGVVEGPVGKLKDLFKKTPEIAKNSENIKLPK